MCSSRTKIFHLDSPPGSRIHRAFRNRNYKVSYSCGIYVLDIPNKDNKFKRTLHPLWLSKNSSTYNCVRSVLRSTPILFPYVHSSYQNCTAHGQELFLCRSVRIPVFFFFFCIPLLNHFFYMLIKTLKKLLLYLCYRRNNHGTLWIKFLWTSYTIVVVPLRILKEEFVVVPRETMVTRVHFVFITKNISDNGTRPLVQLFHFEFEYFWTDKLSFFFFSFENYRIRNFLNASGITFS